MARLEFYIGNSDKFIATLRNEGAVPRKGDLINITQENYMVMKVVWCVDWALEQHAELRTCVILRKVVAK